MRIVHLSDIHVWRYTWDPRRLINQRFLVMLDLLRGRAGRFRLERIEEVIDRVRQLGPDHVLITGDLTTTATPAEFNDARKALEPLLTMPGRVSIVPGNHDRTTTRSRRSRRFEETFADCLPAPGFPWLRTIDSQTAILGLDPTRSHISARGLLPPGQLAAAGALLRDPGARPARLIVACHYPLAAPVPYTRELNKKRLSNAAEVRDWARTIGPHLYCCGHVHAAWAFVPPELPEQLCLNAGAPLMIDPTGQRQPGFLEIDLDDLSVRVIHHAWDGSLWQARPIYQADGFFRNHQPEHQAALG